jgi:HD-GYP domain-containing protein (c-di-GMP phosphodiesterase class II)
MKNITTYVPLAATLGSVSLLVFSFFRSLRIRDSISGALLKKYRVILSLKAFFILGYMAFAAALWKAVEEVTVPFWHQMLVTVILVAGACFVYLSTRLAESTLTELKNSGDHLEERTEKLENEIALRTETEGKLNDQLHTLTTIIQINRAIAANLDLESIFEGLLENIIVELKVDAVDVLLFDKATATLNYAAGKGFASDRIVTSRVAIGAGDAGAAFTATKKFVIPDLQAPGSRFDRSHKSFYKLNDPYLVREEGFRAYLNIPLLSENSLVGILEIFNKQPFSPSPEWFKIMNAVAGQAAVAIHSATQFGEIIEARDTLSRAYETTIEGWARALDYRDSKTEGHSRRLSDQTEVLAHLAGIPDEKIVHIRRGALLHDMGKLGIPDAILRKEGPLTEEEWKIMRSHPAIGYKMLAPIDFLAEALEIPYCHHERWDGAGYPRGLKGDDIPLSARLFSVVDVWDALRMDRPYRKALPKNEVVDYIHEDAGKHFDPFAVDVFEKAITQNLII